MKFVADSGIARDAWVSLEQAASSPYNGFVYGDEALSRRVSDVLMTQGISEASPPWGRLAVADDGAPLGLIAVLSAKQLRNARLKAAFALAKAGIRFEPEVVARIRLASETMAQVGDDEAYLSRIAVMPGARGHGIGRQLMHEVVDTAKKTGARAVVLQVSPAHDKALRMYLAAGFSETNRRTAHDPVSQRTLEYLHLRRVVA